MDHWKSKARIQKFKKTGDTKYIYRNELNKAFDIAKNLKYDGSKRGITSKIYKCFDKKSKGSGVNKKINKMNNFQKNYTKQLLESF